MSFCLQLLFHHSDSHMGQTAVFLEKANCLEFVFVCWHCWLHTQKSFINFSITQHETSILLSKINRKTLNMGLINHLHLECLAVHAELNRSQTMEIIPNELNFHICQLHMLHNKALNKPNGLRSRSLVSANEMGLCK